MDRLHLRLRSLVALGLLLGCTERGLDEDNPEEREAACMWIIAPDGHWNDGRVLYIVDEKNRRAPTVCMCMTQEEYDDKVYFDELNDRAYDECKRLAAPHNFDWDECWEQYERGDWLNDVFWARGSFANGPPKGFTCDEEGQQGAGCSVRE